MEKNVYYELAKLFAGTNGEHIIGMNEDQLYDYAKEQLDMIVSEIFYELKDLQGEK